MPTGSRPLSTAPGAPDGPGAQGVRTLAPMAAEPMPDDSAHGGEHLRWMRERAGMTRAELAARVASDPLDPRPYIDAEWIALVEAGSGVRDVSYGEWTALWRGTEPPRPDWWEGGYEHDLRFAWSGHREPDPDEHGRRRYWARVKTVAEERGRGYRAEPDFRGRLRVLCELFNAYGVVYVLVGASAAVGHGVRLETQDVDVVPRPDEENLRRLCDALNVLGPRWPSPDRPAGRKIDGGRLEPRHFRSDMVALGLVTRLGDIDVLFRPRGFELGFAALEPNAVVVSDEGVDLHLAALDDVIRSKELLDRPKDREQLPALYRRREELRAEGTEPPDPA